MKDAKHRRWYEKKREIELDRRAEFEKFVRAFAAGICEGGYDYVSGELLPNALGLIKSGKVRFLNNECRISMVFKSVQIFDDLYAARDRVLCAVLFEYSRWIRIVDDFDCEIFSAYI